MSDPTGSGAGDGAAAHDAAEARAELLREHRDVIRRRQSVPLGSHEYRQLADEVARIEVEIARLDEPPIQAVDDRTG